MRKQSKFLYILFNNPLYIDARAHEPNFNWTLNKLQAKLHKTQIQLVW